MKNTFNKYICSTCKAKCNKEIVVIAEKGISTMKCADYEKDETKVQGYERPKLRTAKQRKALMGFTQEY